MSDCQIQFRYCQEDIIIKCQKKELMKDIINRYGTKLGLLVNKFSFFYNGNKIDIDLTLDQINNQNKTVLILVYPNVTEENENEIKKSNFIKSSQYTDPAKKSSKNNNEIIIKIKIEEGDVNNNIYFLDNTSESIHPNGYYEKESKDNVKHNHDNLSELNETNTSLFIDGKIVPFKKYFIPRKSGIYSIKLLFKIKLANCAYMFCECNNIIEIDFSKFNTENIKNMQYFLYCCSGLSSLNLSSFNTQNVDNMRNMFYGCSSLKSLNLSSFNTKNVTYMGGMFRGCSSLTILNLSSFNTQNVTYMYCMFCGCSSLTTLNLFSFNTENVNNMGNMFYKCSSLKTLNLSSFNTQNVTNMESMFYKCSSLTTLNLSSFNTNNVTNMLNMFDGCYSLTKLNISSFNAEKAIILNIFEGCINLSSCGSFDKKIADAFKNKK